MERTMMDSDCHDNRKVVENQCFFRIRLPAKQFDFESRLFDQLEYCSITEVLYQHLGEKAIIFCGFYGLFSSGRALMRQISWVMVPIGQKLHQHLGLNRTFTARPMMVEVSMML